MSAQESLLEIIRAYIPLRTTDEILIRESLVPQTLRKGELLLAQGAPNTIVCYLEYGLLRSFYFNENGSEITAGFFQEGRVCTDLKSYQSGGSSERSIEALLDSKVWVFNRSQAQQFRDSIAGWAYFEQRYIADLLLDKVNFQRAVTKGSAGEAYALFNETYNQAARYAPRYQIASFLGISPYTLSRIKISR